MKLKEPTEIELERATEALVPFVEAWRLYLNPEDLQLMAYAVLTEFAGEWNEAETFAIGQRVEALISEDRQAHQRMSKAWQADIARRQAVGEL